MKKITVKQNKHNILILADWFLSDIIGETIQLQHSVTVNNLLTQSEMVFGTFQLQIKLVKDEVW